MLHTQTDPLLQSVHMHMFVCLSAGWVMHTQNWGEKKKIPWGKEKPVFEIWPECKHADVQIISLSPLRHSLKSIFEGPRGLPQDDTKACF